MHELYQQMLYATPDSVESRLLVTLSLVVLTVMALSLMFAVLSMLLRLRGYYTQRMWRRLQTLWDGDILKVLCGDSSQSGYLALVSPGQEIHFMRFLAPYAWRLRESDAAILSSLAGHHLHHVT